MLTVPEAARRLNRNPETVRRWIRSGLLPARKVGTQHILEEEDLARMETPGLVALPPSWGQMMNGDRMPNVAAWVRRSRLRDR